METLYKDQSPLPQPGPDPIPTDIKLTFNETSGCITQGTTGAIEGTFLPDCSGENAPIWSTLSAVDASSLIFDGVDDNIYFPQGLTYNSEGAKDFSLSGWVNISSADLVSPMVIASGGLSDNEGWVLIATKTTSGAPLLRLQLINEGVWYLGTDYLTLDSWSHFAMTYDSAAKALKLYTDGALSRLGPTNSQFMTPSFGDYFSIGGKRFGGEAKYFKGGLDEFNFYNLLLSTEELTTLFNQFKP